MLGTSSFIHKFDKFALLDNMSAKRLDYFYKKKSTLCPPPVPHNQVLMGWAIFSFFHWQRTSPVGIVCISWCYIRKYEMKEFVRSHPAFCAALAAAAYSGSIKRHVVVTAWSLKWNGSGKTLSRCKNKQTNVHAQTLLFALLSFSLLPFSHQSPSPALSLSFTDVHKWAVSSQKSTLTIDSCFWRDSTDELAAKTFDGMFLMWVIRVFVSSVVHTPLAKNRNDTRSCSKTKYSNDTNASLTGKTYM